MSSSNHVHMIHCGVHLCDNPLISSSGDCHAIQDRLSWVVSPENRIETTLILSRHPMGLLGNPNGPSSEIAELQMAWHIYLSKPKTSMKIKTKANTSCYIPLHYIRKVLQRARYHYRMIFSPWNHTSWDTVPPFHPGRTFRCAPWGAEMEWFGCPYKSRLPNQDHSARYHSSPL